MKPLIICVDDDYTILRGLELTINETFSGVCRIELAQSGNEAIELVDQMLQTKQDIAMVITDYCMPGMNGDELIGTLCEKLPYSTMALMTGFNDAEIIARTVNAGRLDRYIAKPWKKEEIENIVYEVLRMNMLRRELEKKNAELSLASQMARIGVVRINYHANSIHLSDEWFSVFGYDRENVTLDFAFYESLFHPEDRTILANIRKDNIAGKTGESYCSQMRMKDGSGNWRWIECCLSAVDYDDNGSPIEYLGIAQDITEQKNREDMLVKAQEKSEILDNLAEQVTYMTNDLKVIWTNRVPEGCTCPQKSGYICYQQWYDRNSVCEGCAVPDAIATGQKCSSEVSHNGRIDSMIAIPVKNDSGTVLGVIVSQTDITQRRQMEMRLAHAQQMESIGSLAAGIAHEINTPIQYIGDNITFLSRAFTRIKATCDSLITLVESYGLADSEVNNSLEIARSNFAMVPEAIDDAIAGVSHVSQIVSAMKDFSHPSVEVYGRVDLNQIVENATTISRNEWKYLAQLKTNFQHDSLYIQAVPNSISQVLLNLIINAAHAVEQKYGTGNTDQGYIEIKTFLEDNFAIVEIMDNGCGIDDSIKARVFDPFFTSKEVGKGTGQGLAIAYDIVVEKHGGSIDFDSTTGIGTTFTVRLPLHNVSTNNTQQDYAQVGR